MINVHRCNTQGVTLLDLSQDECLMSSLTLKREPGITLCQGQSLDLVRVKVFSFQRSSDNQVTMC